MIVQSLHIRIEAVDEDGADTAGEIFEKVKKLVKEETEGLDSIEVEID